MKFKVLNILIVLIVLLNNAYSQAQAAHNNYITLPDIALLDIEPNTSDVILEFEAPSSPGDKLIAVDGSSKWINYTATQSIGGSQKEISAQISSSTNIPGLSVDLIVSSYQGGGKGDLGNSVGQITLSTTAQTIINGIGGCYTRSGNNSGHKIDYSAQITDYSLFEVPSSASMEIIFTITN